MPNDKVIKLHSYLKSQDVTVPESVDEFEKGLNEERITKLHSYLRDNDVVVPEDVSEFSSALKKKGQAGQSQELSGSDSKTPTQKPKQPSSKSGEDDEIDYTKPYLDAKGIQASFGKKEDAFIKEMAAPVQKRTQQDNVTFNQQPKPILKDISVEDRNAQLARKQAEKETTFDVIRNAIDQGSAQGDVENTFKALYDGATPEELKAFTEANKRIEKIQTHPSVKKFEESEGTWGWVSAFAENPMDIALHLMTKSTTSLLKTGGQAVSEGITTGAVGGATIGTMVTPGIGTAAGFVGGASAGLAAGMAKAGFDAGMASDMVQSMKDSGIDIKDPKSVEKALKDKDKMDAWQKHALKYNIPIAAFDLFSAGLGGKIFAPAKSVGSKIAKGIAETAIQAGLDASGEAAGQLAADKRLDAKGIFSEVAGGLPQQAVEVATGMLNNEKPVNATLDKGESISNAIQYKLAQGEIASKKAEILASLEPDGNGGVIMTPEAKAELDKLENARVQVQESTQREGAITEGAQPSDVTIESAVIEIGGQTFEGKNHAEAILKAQQAGKDISQVDRKGQGMFKLSDGSVISRDEAQATFGADKAEMLILQDENANEANREYEKIKKEQVGRESLEKVETREADEIVNMPMKDVPDMVEVRVKQQESALNTTSKQADIEKRRREELDKEVLGAGMGANRTLFNFKDNTVVSDAEIGLADKMIDNAISKSKSIEDANLKLEKLGYNLRGATTDAFNQFVQDRIDGKTNKSFKEWREESSKKANEINAKYDAEYIDKVRKGEFTAQQAKDALKEINRLTPELSKQLDDAELASLKSENKPIPNQKSNFVKSEEVKVKEADIEQKSLELSKKKDDWTIESWNERFDELLTQEEIDGINKERNDFNKKLNEVLNEPTKEQNVQASVLDQSGTEDSQVKEGTEQELKPKSVYKNSIERADISEDTKNTLRENLYYNVLTEKEASSIADALIEESGSHEKALATLESDKGFAGSVKTFVYVKAIDAQTKLYNKAETKEQKTLIAESQSQLLSDLDEFVRDAGRAISAVSHLYKTTEEGQLLYRKKQINKINQELTDSEISPEEFEKVKKELDNAILESANSKEVNETVKKLQEEINRLKAKLESATSGLSATENKRAKAKALIADGVNELVSFVGAKKNIVEENGLMKPDAQKAIGKIIKGIQLSLELNGQDLFNHARRVISEKLKGAFTYDQIDDAIASHPEFGGVWQKEKTILINQLSKKAIDGIKGLKDKTAINQLADRLAKSMKDKTKQSKPSKDGTFETIADLLKNPEAIDEITSDLISHLESKGYTKEEAILVAGNVYDNVTKTLDTGTDRLVKEGSKDILGKKEDLRAFINSTLENQEATIESIAKEITDNMGLSEKQALDYAKQIKQSFDKAFSSKKEKLISDKFKTKKKATKRREVEQIYTLINAGIQDYSDFKGRFYESLGGINLNNPVVDEKLRELSANISRANSDHTRYLAEQSMMDYIASKTSSSWLKRGVSLGYCNMLSSYDTPLRNFSFGASVVIQDMGNTVARLSKAVLTKNEKEMYGALYTFSAMGKSVLGKGTTLARDVIRTGNMFESVDSDVVSDILNNKHRKVDTPINWALDKYYKGMSLAFRNLKAGDAFLSQPINAKLTFKRLYDSEIQRNSELPQDEQKSYAQIAKEVSSMFDKITPQSHTDLSIKAAKEVETSQKLEVPLLVTKEDGTVAYNPAYADKKYNDIKRMHQLVAYELQEKSNGLSLEEKKEIKQESQEKLLMGQPTGDGGMIASMVNNAFKNSPLGKLLFVPFVNVPLNSFNQIIERSPFGTMVYSGKYLSAMIRNKKLASPMNIDISSATLWSDKSVKNAGLDPYLNARQKTRIIQRQVASYAILGAVSAMMQVEFEEDELDRYGKNTGRKTKRKLIDVSGNGLDYQKNEQFSKATGYWKPYSIIFYNPISKETTSFSYKNSPLIGILAPLGKLSDYEKFENDKSAEKQLSINKVALLSTMATLEAVADQSTLKGMGDIYKSIADISTSLKDDKSYGLVKLLAKKIAGGIPAPVALVKALYQDVSAMMDMDDRKANEAYEYAMQDIPFLDTLMSVGYDHFGRPVKQISDVPLLYTGTYEKDDYYGRAFPFKYTFTVMKDDVVKDESTGTEYAITKTQLAELNKVAGENLKKSLDNGVYNAKITELNKIKSEPERNKAFKTFMDNKVTKARALAKKDILGK